jgi:hypothetical protein
VKLSEERGVMDGGAGWEMRGGEKREREGGWWGRSEKEREKEGLGWG